MRGSIPKPFKRPSTVIGASQREWREVPADTIQPEDIVPNIGVVAAVHTKGKHVLIEGKYGRSGTFGPTDIIYAFVLKQSQA